MTDIPSQNPYNGCLILAPAVISPNTTTFATLLDYLKNIKFIGLSLAEQINADSFKVGDEFLQLITFMGCSPHVEFDQKTHGSAFTYIHIDGPWAEPKLRYGRNTQAPRCRNCRQRIPNWRESVADWLVQPQQVIVTCPRCQHSQSPLELTWRKEAGFGYLFIVIENIFPSEAAPVPGFLTNLSRNTNVPWHYFYVLD